MTYTLDNTIDDNSGLELDNSFIFDKTFNENINTNLNISTNCDCACLAPFIEPNYIYSSYGNQENDAIVFLVINNYLELGFKEVNSLEVYLLENVDDEDMTTKYLFNDFEFTKTLYGFSGTLSLNNSKEVVVINFNLPILTLFNGNLNIHYVVDVFKII